MPIEPGNLSLGVLVGGLIGIVASHYLTKSRNAEERRLKSINDAIENIKSAALNHQLAVSRNLESIRITEFNKAAAAFYIAFLDDIIFLEDTEPEEVPIELLKRTEISKKRERDSIDIQHRKARVIFRPYIDKSDLAGFDAAWFKYYKWSKHYVDENDKEYDFKSHLDSLLEYAKPKS